MDKIMKNIRGLELVTSGSSGYKARSEKFLYYSQVSNRRGVWNSKGLEKYQKLIVGGLEKTESFNSRDGGGAWVGF